MEALLKYTLYDDLLALPENLTGEILNGQLHAQPRPSPEHTYTESALQIEVGGPFHVGKGGPGGWWILVEPEIHFVRYMEVCVPDLAGWRKERMPSFPKNDEKFETTPEWVCEILSPSTESKDRQIKMEIYARYGVRFAWLIDPIKRILEAYESTNRQWREIGIWRESDKGHVPPFDAIELKLNMLWA